MISNSFRYRVLTVFATVLAALGVATYVAIVIEARFDLANSALFPLVLMGIPFGVALALLRFAPRAGRVFVVLAAAVLLGICGTVAAQNGVGGWWADVLTLVAGVPLAIGALVVAVLPGTGAGRDIAHP